MVELKVSNVIDVLSKSFSSVDFRIAAIKEANWVLVTSSVVFSHLQPEEIRSKHERITQKIDKVLGDSLRFFLLAHPISQWQNIVDQFSVGRIRADSIDIMVNAVDISNLTVNDNYPNPPYVKDDEWKVVGAEAILQGNGKKFSTTLEECRGNAKVLGYAEADELTREILRIREYHGSVDRYVVLGSPIYARILSHTVKANHVIVPTQLHAGL